MLHEISTGDLKNQIVSKLAHTFGVTPEEAVIQDYYKTLVLVVKDKLLEDQANFKRKVKESETKTVYYLCMEFLLGRSLKNNLFNLGIESVAREALNEFGIDIDSVYEEEPDAGLGNGGLGRLAACFLDSLAAEGYSAMGYSLRYEYGIFKQKLIDGWQTELPDFWLENGGVWLQPHPEKSVEVLFDGKVKESWDGGRLKVEIVNATKVTAVPYDMVFAGYRNGCVSRLRLWAAKSENFDMDLFNSGDYVRAVEQNAMIEVITKVLYPEDNHPEGKSLRLAQQYFLVSATVQDIVKRHLRRYGTLDNLTEAIAVHLNDTHPVLVIPEMMRIMLDEYNYSWDDAWTTVQKTVAYTNHTVMSEALECWGQDLFKRRLPRIFQIVEEINKRFCAQMHEIGVDGYQVGRMAVLNDEIIKMANLAVIASHSVNGVSKLHSNILKQRVFKDFYAVDKEKFKNVTNGIAHRRWLSQANPNLSKFLCELIGDGFIKDAQKLKYLLKYKDDKSVLQELDKIKRENKLLMIKYIKGHNKVIVDPDSIFDVQVKRLHEYKRQLLNALHVLSTYKWLCENPNADFVPKTYIFGAKAAPGYYFAKQIIRFIVKLGDIINHDPRVSQKLKVVYLEDYDVTIAEKLIPASEISEQISLAGTEASGTGNMKFMINGAITIGTLDGANVEITELVGEENIVLFGMREDEVEKIKESGYDPMIHYNNNESIRRIVDQMRKGLQGMKFDDIVNSLTIKDPYMVLADFADYAHAQQKLSDFYKDRTLWNKISLINIANAGYFSSDRSIKTYADEIWNVNSLL